MSSVLRGGRLKSRRPASYSPSMRLKKDAKIERLRTVPLFARCSKKQLATIASLCDELELPPGRELAHEGARGYEFGVIVEGSAVVTKGGQKLRELGAGDFFGEIALVTDTPRTATVVSDSPIRLLVLTARGFRELLRQSPEIQGNVLRALADRLAADAA
jgi:CRP/FNR family cyclic AMP-dependent transcriptional regulator